MSFLYFAYGSNLWPAQIRSRCRSARRVGKAVLGDWAAVYDKPGADGSAKMNLRESPGSETHGVIYEIADAERQDLDRAEPGYTPFRVSVVLEDGGTVEALTYRWAAAATTALPASWYQAVVRRGAVLNGLPADYVAGRLESDSMPDPVAPGITPAGREDLTAMQGLLSRALAAGSAGYTIHPGDLAWWMWHDDPRDPDRLGFWTVPGEGVLVIEATTPEIGAFATPDGSVIDLIEWAQSRMDDEGEVGWVADSDDELVSYLRDGGYQVVDTCRLYHRDLGESDIPEPEPPPGWRLRPVRGEDEVAQRRRASHAAFDSNMSPRMHTERYLRFMRSPVYERERDLVAVGPDGRVGAFMIWWPDSSGVAQIEPFGTHPEFQRRGVGRALMHHGLSRMKGAGMSRVRVLTEDHRSDATGFYESVGFDDVDRVRWWKRPS